MAVRDFTDRKGRSWKAWDVRPEAIHPATKEEDFLAEAFHSGWVVFENASGGEKRRLSPIPKGWATMSDADLEELSTQAVMIPARKLARERMTDGAPVPGAAALGDKALSDETPDITDLAVVRTFRYPGGRIWSVCVMNHPETGAQPVLRFSAGSRSLDLKIWPKDWADYPDARLVELLRAGALRPASPAPGPTTPRRRHDDGPAAGPG